MGYNVETHICIRRPGRKLKSLSGGFVDPVWLPRNYGLYGLMAGVSGRRVLFEPRGIPGNADRSLLYDLRDSKAAVDLFSHSWLTTEELREVAHVYETEPSFGFEPVEFERTDPPPPERTTKLSLHLPALIGAMEAVDRWCETNGGGQAVLVIAFS